MIGKRAFLPYHAFRFMEQCERRSGDNGNTGCQATREVADSVSRTIPGPTGDLAATSTQRSTLHIIASSSLTGTINHMLPGTITEIVTSLRRHNLRHLANTRILF